MFRRMVLTCNPQARKARRTALFQRAEKYANEYRTREREEIRLKRIAKQNGEFYVPAQPKIYFVVRLRGCVFLSFLS